MHIRLRGIVFSALFAALLAVFSFIRVPLPFTPVPITLENLAVILAGALLGPLYGFLSMLLVVILTAAGLPMLDGQGGISILVGPTGGYIWMWPICALLAGYFVRRVKGNGVRAFILIFLSCYVFGDLISYLTAIPWLKHTVPVLKTWQSALDAGAYPYLLGDALKALVTTIIVLPVRRVFPVSRIIGGPSAVFASSSDVSQEAR